MECCCVCTEQLDELLVCRARYLLCGHPICETCMLKEFVVHYRATQAVILKCPCCRRLVTHVQIDRRFAFSMVPVYKLGRFCAGVLDHHTSLPSWRHLRSISIISALFHRHHGDEKAVRRSQLKSKLAFRRRSAFLATHHKLPPPSV